MWLHKAEIFNRFLGKIVFPSIHQDAGAQRVFTLEWFLLMFLKS